MKNLKILTDEEALAVCGGEDIRVCNSDGSITVYNEWGWFTYFPE